MAPKLLKTAAIALLALSVGVGEARGEGRERMVRAMKAPRSYAIKDDGGTVSHVYFDGTSLRDTKDAGWAMQGTVPQVGKSPPAPAGAGAFSDVNHYALAASSFADFAGPFSACFIYKPASTANNPYLIADGSWGTAGWELQVAGNVAFSISLDSGAAVGVLSGGGALTTSLNATCGGWSGTEVIVKHNELAAVSAAAATFKPSPSTVTRLGDHAGAGNALDGVVYEAWFSTTPASAALFDTIHQAVKAKYGIAAW